MLPNDIEWFDGMDANGKIVLEIVYRDNGKGYLKGSLDQIYDHYNIMADCPKVAELVIYNVDGKEMVRKVCLSNLV